jgi:hypothetical protein
LGGSGPESPTLWALLLLLLLSIGWRDSALNLILLGHQCFVGPLWKNHLFEFLKVRCIKRLKTSSRGLGWRFRKIRAGF